MSDDDKDFPRMDAEDIDQPQQLQLREYDWAVKPVRKELSLDELKQALAVLAVLEMEEDEDETSVRVH